jgi:hypothetical protein
MDLAIGVLEYFARDAEHQLTTRQFTAHPPIDPQLAGQIGVLHSMLSAFMRLHRPKA